MQRKAFLLSSSALILSGCGQHSSNARFEDLRAGGEPLRTAFNRDADSVRVVMLVSPT